ncbi:heptaprenylglyceryl phosphate synthase [Halobium palmae]|uniref:Geranylgeranylglyceryl phosphate synthase n=1 Tax=Halobium palmae TaxID=1776492 RepID=A0ABD5RY56_9EURY
MSIDWNGVTHVTKVDPAEELPSDLALLDRTDLVIVGGSDDVTEENTLAVLERLRSAHPELPLFQEPYSASHVSSATVEAVDALSVPAVYNGDRDNFVSKHVEFFTEIARKPDEAFGAGLPVVGEYVRSKGREAVADLAEKVLGEAYVVQNLDSEAAAESGVDAAYTPEQVAGAALATESFYGFEVFYVEYSGTYGGPEDVEAAATHLDDTVLLYGGGIRTQEQTEEILDAGADAVVVGDVFHEDPDAYLRTVPE